MATTDYDLSACCGCGTVTCDNCDTGLAPPNMRVVITGITNGSCSDCAVLNIDEILPSIGVVGSECDYQLDDIVVTCSETFTIGVAIGKITGNSYVNVTLSSTSAFEGATFLKNYTGLADCLGFSNENIPRIAGLNVKCNYTAAACHIYAA